MERPSYTRQDTETVGGVDEKKPHNSAVDIDHSSEEYHHQYRSSKEHTSKDEAGLPTYQYHDTEAAIGEGEIGTLETAEDIVTTVIHVDDDPTLNPWTFRMFFIGEFPRTRFVDLSRENCCMKNEDWSILGLGLAAFGAVLQEM